METDDREHDYLELVKSAVLELCSDNDCRVYFFGSRKTGQCVRSSDYDIGLSGMSEEGLCRFKQRLEDWWEDSIVPHPIDVVDLDHADTVFKEKVMREGELWKTALN